MFNRFTQQARDTVIAAQLAARTRRDPAITARHIAIALTAIDGVGDEMAGHGVTVDFLDAPHPAQPEAAATDRDADALKSLGIDLDSVRAAVEETFGPGALDNDPPAPTRRRWPFGSKQHSYPTVSPGQRERGTASSNSGHIPFSAGAKRALENSLREAARVRSNDIRAEHLALGLFDCADPDLPPLPQALRAAIEGRLRDAA